MNIEFDWPLRLVVVLAGFLTLTAVAATVFLFPAWLHARVRYHNLHESERFKREPRVGDKAGYRLDRSTYVVGWVYSIDNLVENRPTVLGLETPTEGPMGTIERRSTRYLQDLRWFPPDTPLGINVVKDEESAS